MNPGLHPFRVFALDKPILKSRRVDSNRLPLLQLRVITQALQRLANPAFLSWFLCSGLLSVAPYCAPGGISVVSRGISGYARCGSLYSSHGWPDRLSDEGCIALFHRREDLVARAAPYLRVEDLDLNGAGVAGIIDRLADAPELNHPVPHHPPFQQRIACRNHPVVNVEPQDAP